MLEMLYRIYRTLTEKEKSEKEKMLLSNSFSMYNSYSNENNKEVLMDCYICETREDFKNHIRDIYGKDIKFANSKKFPPNTYYCIIIGEHCYNVERYFNKVEYVCDYCGSKVIQYIDKPIKIDGYTLKTELFNIQEYNQKRFCCESCRYKYIEQEKQKIKPKDEQEFFISRDMFTEKISGYIYKITKKSTGEFYIGQTIYAPVFRWGQHLKTDRFEIKNILDYKFETIEIVPIGENILEREKYWIQKYYNDNPTLSLNIMQTQELRNK